MKETLAAKRRRLIQSYREHWAQYLAIEHVHVESRTIMPACAAGCPGCPEASKLTAAMRLLTDEIREVEQQILDPPRRAGAKQRASDVDILLTFMDPKLTSDAQRAKRVHLSSSAFAKRKANLPPEFAAIISG